jgi:hypothetical protein
VKSHSKHAVFMENLCKCSIKSHNRNVISHKEEKHMLYTLHQFGNHVQFICCSLYVFIDQNCRTEVP